MRKLLTKELIASGVWGVGVSRLKFRRGVPHILKMPVLVFFVTKKLPMDQVPKDARIEPAMQVEGVEYVTDVIESARPRALIIGAEGLRPVEKIEECGCNMARCRPLTPGTSMCDAELTACTYTGPFTDSRGNTYFLTNSHCTKYSITCNESDLLQRPMVQPSPLDRGDPGTDVVGYTVDATRPEEDTTDTAVIRPLEGVEYILRPHYAEADIRGWADPEPAMQVYKSGRSSYLTTGMIIATNVSAIVQYPCGDKTVVGVAAATAMSRPGDSGSPVFTKDGVFVGQLFAGSDTVTLMIPPSAIKERFGLEVGAGEEEAPLKRICKATVGKIFRRGR